MLSFKTFIMIAENYDEDLEEAHMKLDHHHSKNFTDDQSGNDWDQMRNVVPYADQSPRIDFSKLDDPKNLTLKDVPTESLKSPQHTVSYDVVRKKLNNEIAEHYPEHPIVVHHKGIHYVFDGNHRASCAILKNEPTMKAYVLEAPEGTHLGTNAPQKPVHPDTYAD